MDIISIIIPCYNSQEYIKETIDSVKRQTSTRWECVIVDDGSTDLSGEIIDEATENNVRFKVYHAENSGVADARNFAISKAKGKYILPLDADDKLKPEAVDVLLSAWENNPDKVLIVPKRICFDNNGYVNIGQREYEGYDKFKWSCCIINTSCFKKEDWKRIGGYRNGTKCEDFEFWIRLLYKNDDVLFIDNILLEYRLHGDSRWQTTRVNMEREMKIIQDMNPEIYKMEETKDEILVVIPYFAKPAQGRELELAVTGWRKYFKEKFKIVIVGDWHPIVKTGDDIVFIGCPRVKWPGQGNYWPHIDHVHKFRVVHDVFPESKGFIYTCDDIYATKDFAMKDVLKPKVQCRAIGGSYHHPNAWVRDNYRTKKILDKAKLPSMNWVCHLPVYYEWDKLFEIYEKFNCDKVSKVVEQLYFNTYMPKDFIVIEGEEENDYQYRIRKKDEFADMPKMLGKKIWINNSEKGWKKEIDEVLAEYYGI